MVYKRFLFSLKTLQEPFSFPILNKKKKLRMFEFLAITMDKPVKKNKNI